jgi:SOS-response transcriptional repressor LexA
MFRRGGRGDQIIMTVHHPPAPARRDQVLAFIVDRIVRTGTSPTFDEIGLALQFSSSRAKQLVDQLVKRGVIEKTPGAQRNLRVRDVTQSRTIVAEALRGIGWIPSGPMAPLPGDLPNGQLPMLPPFEHFPDID